MAIDLTAQQESVSAKFFQVFLDNNWDPTDKQYEELLSDCFGSNGIYPLGNSKKDVEWKTSFDKQVLALQIYMTSRSIPASGWEWSRGDGMMGFLNDIAQQRCGVSTLDSWNPMDIVGVKTNKESALRRLIEQDVIIGVDKDTNKSILNGIMIEAILKKELMPVSLKKIKSTERPAMEVSNDLKGNNAKLRAKHDFKYVNFQCDLEWSTYKNEWRHAQEISWDMNDRGGVIRAPYFVHVQARAFQGKNPREKPQHSLAAKGAGAMLGKSSIVPLDEFVKNLGFRPTPSPNAHRYIPSPGQPWKKTQRNYWIGIYNRLKGVRIAGQSINFGRPGAYGESMSDRQMGFPAALDAAIEADENDYKTRGQSRSSGSRLIAKLWGMEWLSRYYEISKRKKFDAFAYQIYKASTKELPLMGPFIKIFGQTGRSRKEIKANIQRLIDEGDIEQVDWDNILDK